MKCARCHKEFSSGPSNKRYCSRRCRYDAFEALRKANGRAIAGLPERECEVCGASYRPAKTFQRFCSAACRCKYSRGVAGAKGGRKRRLKCSRCGGAHRGGDCPNVRPAVKAYGTVDPVTRAYIPPPGVKVRHVQITPFTHGEELTRLFKELGDA